MKKWFKLADKPLLGWKRGKRKEGKLVKEEAAMLLLSTVLYFEIVDD